jgi:hypothetical protein
VKGEGKRRRRRPWKTGRLHWPGGHAHEHAEDEQRPAERLRPPEETEGFKDSFQQDSGRSDDTIRVDSASVQMPEHLVEEDREGANIFRLEPVALFILFLMLAFIAFIAWRISLMPDK